MGLGVEKPDEGGTPVMMVSDVMTPASICLSAGDTVATAAAALRDLRLPMLAVLNAGTFAGVITPLDLLGRDSALPVSGLMTRGVTPAVPQMPLLQAHALFASQPFDVLPVLDRGRPVGWVSLGPREDFAKLKRSSVMKPVDAKPVWSIICFVVPQEFRGQGVARALLDGAIAYAKKRGATLVEAYPVDRAARGRDDSMWFGAKSMYDAAGFDEVARRKPQRPVVRLKIK